MRFIWVSFAVVALVLGLGIIGIAAGEGALLQLNDLAASFVDDDELVISVDTKKKELIGDCWPTRSMNTVATGCVEMRLGRADLLGGGRGHRVVGCYSAVISVTADRADDSSTMALLVA